MAPLCLLPRHCGKEPGGPWAGAGCGLPSVTLCRRSVPTPPRALGHGRPLPPGLTPGALGAGPGAPCAESSAAAPNRWPSLVWGDAGPG